MSKKSGPIYNSEPVKTAGVKSSKAVLLLAFSFASTCVSSQLVDESLSNVSDSVSYTTNKSHRDIFEPSQSRSATQLNGTSFDASKPKDSKDTVKASQLMQDASSQNSEEQMNFSQTRERNQVLEHSSARPENVGQEPEVAQGELEQQLKLTQARRTQQRQLEAKRKQDITRLARERVWAEQRRQLEMAQERKRKFLERIDELSRDGLLGIKQKGKRLQAITALEEVIKLVPNDERQSQWKDALQTGYYDQAIEKGEIALNRRSASRARRAYAQALRYDSSRYEAYVGLAEAAMLTRRTSAAVTYMQKALARMQGVAPEQTIAVRARFRVIRAVYLTEKAENFQSAGQHEARIDALREAAKLSPENPLSFYHWAMACIEAGRPQDALAAYSDIDRSFYAESAWAYPYALVLYRLGRVQEALLLMEGAEGKSNEALAFESRIRTEYYVDVAKALAQEKNYSGALEQLELAANDAAWIRELKAQWLEQSGDDETALSVWESLFNESAYQRGARLSAAQLHLKHERPDHARLLLEVLSSDEKLTIQQAHQVALGLVTVGDKTGAVNIYNKYAGRLGSDANEEGAVFSRDRGDLLREVGDVEGALGAYRQAFVNAGLVKAYPIADEVFTRAMMTPGGDDGWLADSLRRRSADLYQDRNVVITASVDHLRSEGSEGYSDLRASVGIFQGQFPAFGGRMTLRQSTVRYDVGTIQPGWSGLGFCPNGMQYCNRTIDQKKWGTALSMAWSGQRYRFDVGTTPIGFHYVDLVGGVSGKFFLGQLAGTWEVYRRAKESSLLAFGGQQDPVTGRWWGGVRKTGVAVNLGYDPGRTFGGWTRASVEMLRGRHVAHNWNWQVMTGGYARLINKPNHELALGASGMFWGFDKDLSSYAFGQGGYYSPQLAFSSGISLTDSGRTENFSWKLQARAGWGYDNKEPQKRYPLGAIKPEWNNITSRYSSGNSASHSFDAAFERRLNSHLVLGAVFSAYRSPSYQPTYGMLYLRWYVNGWRGDMPMPPSAPTPLIPW